MNPLSLRATNLRTFESLELDVPAGCSAITGEILNAPEGVSSNGAGKSSLVQAIELALFGPPPGFRTLEEFVTAGGFADDVEVELRFEHAGRLFVVRRGYSTRGKGKPRLDFEEFEDGCYVPLTRETVRETQALIEATVGLTQEIYRASSYLAQNNSDAFCEAAPAKRKGILSEIVLGRDPIWPRLLGLAQRDRKLGEARLATLEARLEQAEEELRAKPEAEQAFSSALLEETEAVSVLADAERALERAAREWQDAQERAAERRAVEAEAETARHAIQALHARDEAAASARDSLTAARTELAALATAEDVAAAEERYTEARAAYDAAAHELQVLNAKRVEAEQRGRDLAAEQQALVLKAAGLRKRVDLLQAPPGASERCPLCQRVHDDQSRHREIEACWSDMSALEIRDRELASTTRETEARAVALREDVEALGDSPVPSDFEVRRAREQATQRARLEERAVAWQRVVAEVEAPEHTDAKAAVLYDAEKARARLAELPPVDQAALDRIKAAGLVARTEVNAQRVRLDEARQEKARLEAVLDRLAAVARQAETEGRERDTVHARLDDLAVLERAYGRDGIPALITENVAIPLIEQETNRVLQELGTAFRCELRTQREQKDGRLVDALDIAVVDEQGNEREYLTYSGGERERLRIALGVALAVYVKTHGDGSGILTLDEPAYLDDAGRAALLRIMRRLESVFRSVILISNEEMLRESFGSVIHVVRDGAVSRVESQARLERLAETEATA